MQGIRYLHEAIRSALGSFAEEARALRAMGTIEPQALSALVERQRFLRSVCHFHSASEEDLLLPAARCAACAWSSFSHLQPAFTLWKSCRVLGK